MSKYNELGWHELLDRSNVQVDGWDRHIVGHFILQEDTELNRLAEEILEKMADFYQNVGSKIYNLDNA